MPAAGTVLVNPLVAGRSVESDDRTELHGVDGSVLADVRTAPKVFAQLVLETVAATDGAAVSKDVFVRAGELFADAELAGELPHEYCRRASLATGVPISVFHAGLGALRDGLRECATANAAELPAPIQGEGYAVRWTAKDRVLAVIAPSNHPEPHLTWIRALSLGYGVVVRPGGRDPFTPMRLAAALLAAGLPGPKLAVLPSDHSTAEFLVKRAGRAVVYGGTSMLDRWSGNAKVLVRGPGRSKAVLNTPLSDPILEHLTMAVSGEGGVRCTNISVVRTSQDISEVADAMAQRLGDLPVLPVLDPGAVLPVFTRTQADALRAALSRLAKDSFRNHSAGLYRGNPFIQVADGSFVARPVVLSISDPCHPFIGTELPFPFVVLAPWSADDGIVPLRDSLVLNLIGGTRNLVECAIREPSVRKVVVGSRAPWTSRADLPHDGSLTGFLLEPKALLHAEGA